MSIFEINFDNTVVGTRLNTILNYFQSNTFNLTLWQSSLRASGPSMLSEKCLFSRDKK